MKVVIIEFIDEFQDLLRFIHKRSLKLEDFIIVALEPRLQAYLAKHSVSYKNTLLYFNNDSHRKIIIETEKIMENIRQYFVFNDTFGLKGCYQREYSHYITLFCNHILKILEILNKIHKQFNNMELYAHVSSFVSTEPLIADSERYSGMLAQRFAENNKLNFININNNEGKRAYTSSRKKERKVVFLENVFVRILFRFLRKRKIVIIPKVNDLFNKLNSEIAKRHNDIIFLAIDHSDNLFKIVFANLVLYFYYFLLKRQPLYITINLGFIRSCTGNKKVDELASIIDKVTDMKGEELFCYHGVTYHSIVKNKIELAIKPHIKQMILSSHALKKIFVRANITLVMSYVGSGIMAVAGELAKTTGRRSLFVSHAAHPVPVDNYHEMELNTLARTFMLGDFTHVALCAPSQESHLHYFKNKYSDIYNHEVKTGPLIFADIKAGDKYKYKKQLGVPADTITITHAVTTKARCGERFHFLETLDEFLSGLTDVVSAIDMLSNVKLIIRIHPGFHLNDDELKLFLPESDKYLIHRQGPFSNALGASDIIISYSSTVIDEALINGIPVVLYDKWDRYNHFKTGVFNSPQSEDIFPICYVNDAIKLKDALLYMQGKVKGAKLNNSTVSKYCYTSDFSKNLFSFIKETFNK